MANPEKLSGYSRFSGCGAKLGPALLDKALCGLTQPRRPEVLADFSGSEDAGVYRISDDIALVQTIDFFPPIVDDSRLFGEIAAANALSDIYAMGGRPVSAVNVLCYPDEDLPLEYLKNIMEGALSKLIEAETALLGGHSVSDRELKFGFSVNGLIHPDKIIRNNTLRNKDILILTKPLGTGTINTAMKAEMASPQSVKASGQSMRMLNKKASELMKQYNVSACTDVTGFGLAGHAAEMAMGSGMDLHFFIHELPLLPEVMDYLSMGLVPEGTYRNREFRLSRIKNPEAVSPEVMDLIFDPQTSGGLLIALPGKDGLPFLEECRKCGMEASIVGRAEEGTERLVLNA
ncbi:selenide, water dikinase SelD [Oceanispirochaeta sp.]|jgi:selenide,water dikinase|uniref:selenide, water dikinase SelD n=1 Tax=Oceanispirochaeta sp. TaxID=2035350 RepID=UPI00261B889A|nr:selenide, water dikinase SelD [Oceanispirochaeta sp.]MDA3958145.1 selenide, water dikinase SelD [Oceanispirochaeta sp.]